MPQQRNGRTIGTDSGSDIDYKEQIENLLYDAKDWGGDPHIRKDLYGSAQSITDLLARAEAAEARAEKAERERDAAVDLIGWIYYEACVSVEYDVRQHLDWLKDKIEQWRKKKGE